MEIDEIDDLEQKRVDIKFIPEKLSDRPYDDIRIVVKFVLESCIIDPEKEYSCELTASELVTNLLREGDENRERYFKLSLVTIKTIGQTALCQTVIFETFNYIETQADSTNTQEHENEVFERDDEDFGRGNMVIDNYDLDSIKIEHETIVDEDKYKTIVKIPVNFTDAGTPIIEELQECLAA
jgi:hypothetical protein